LAMQSRGRKVQFDIKSNISNNFTNEDKYQFHLQLLPKNFRNVLMGQGSTLTI